MPTYKFEQFNAEITDPIVTVNEDAIIIHASTTEISLEVTLETSDAKLYGVRLNNIAASNLNYEGSTNLLNKAIEGLSQYIVES